MMSKGKSSSTNDQNHNVQSVNVLVLGDEKVGKTSIINTLLSSHFSEKIQPVMHDVKLPTDSVDAISGGGSSSSISASTSSTAISSNSNFTEMKMPLVSTSIWDSSSKAEDYGIIVERIQLANAVVLVYDISRPETLNRVSSYWLPKIQEWRKGCEGGLVPVVVVGNKIDLRSSSSNNATTTTAPSSSTSTTNDNLLNGPEKMNDEIQLVEGSLELRNVAKPLMQRFKMVDSVLECSAKALLNIQQVFYCAQKAVVYPIDPLFNVSDAELQPAFVEALNRIFRIYDADLDGLLSNKELNEFQFKSFGVSLKPAEISTLHKIITADCESGVVAGRGLNLEGFLYLNKLFVERNKNEALWKMLHVAGYDSHLTLHIPNVFIDLPPKERDQSTVLTDASISFLTSTFRQYDDDDDGILTKDQLRKVCCILPGGIPPWTRKGMEAPVVKRNDISSELSLPGWLAMWSLMAFKDPKETLLSFYYLGYVSKASNVIEYTRRRRENVNRSSVQLKAINCLLVGSEGCGKTSLLDALCNRPFSEKKKKSLSSAVSSISCDPNVPSRKPNYLIMNETHASDAPLDFNECDVICFVYDSQSAKSLQYIVEFQKTVPDYIPCVIACTKGDLLLKDYGNSKTWQLASEFCSSLELDAPILTSAKTGQELDGNDSLFSALVKVALAPVSGRPISRSKRAALTRKHDMKKAVLAATLTFAVATITALFLHRKK